MKTLHVQKVTLTPPYLPEEWKEDQETKRFDWLAKHITVQVLNGRDQKIVCIIDKNLQDKLIEARKSIYSNDLRRIIDEAMKKRK